MVTRRRFLAMLGLAPAAPLLAKLPAPTASVARAADVLTYPLFTRETSAWTLSAQGDYIDVRGGRRIYRS